MVNAQSNVVPLRADAQRDETWTTRDATICARGLAHDGYHPLVLLPHDLKGDWCSKIKGKAPASFTASDGWRAARGWQSPSKRFDADKVFKPIHENTRRVPNIGILCGLPVCDADKTLRGYVVAIDIDADDEALIADLHGLFGYVNPIRRGRRGGTFLCVTDSNASSDFALDATHKVQLIAQGRQTAVMGIHPTALKPWKWEYHDAKAAVIPPVANLPVVPREQLEAVLAQHGYAAGGSKKETTAEERSGFEKRWRELQAELKATAPFDFEEVDEELGIKGLLERDSRLNGMLLAEHGDVKDHNGNDQSIGNALRKHYGERFTVHHLKAVLSHYDACAAQEKQNNRYSARIYAKAEIAEAKSEARAEDKSNGETFGVVDDEKAFDEEVKAAEKAKAVSTIEQLEAAIAVADLEGNRPVVKALEAALKQKQRKAKTPMLAPTHLALGGLNSLPPRQYIYRNWLAKGELTVLLAPGARGKSALLLSVAVDIATGVDRLGARLVHPRAVLLYNAEDRIVDMEKRVEAYMIQHSFSDAQKELVRKNLHIQSGAGNLLRFASQGDRNEVVANETLVSQTADYIRAHSIELAVFDPLTKLHGVNENDNVGMDKVAGVFLGIVADTGIAMAIAHHTRKASGRKSQMDADDGRGASSVVNSARIVLSLNVIERPDLFQISDPDVWRYFTVGSGDKMNHSPRDPSVVVFRQNSVQANNGTTEHEADNIVALSLHTYEKRIGIGDEETLEVLAALDGEEPVGSHPRHANWIGRLVANAAGWDVDDKHVRASIKETVAEWERRGWIVATVVEATGKGANRKQAVGAYKRGASRPTPRVYEFGAVDDEDEEA